MDKENKILNRKTKNIKNESPFISNKNNNKDIPNNKKENKEKKRLIKSFNVNYSNPKNINFINILALDTFSGDSLGFIFSDTFCVFISINDIFYVIYTNENKSILSYDLINNKKINEIKNAHKNYITNFRHYLDEHNKRDLILSICCEENNIRLWSLNTWDLILDIQKINGDGLLRSACFLYDSNNIYIVTSFYNYSYNFSIDPIKVFDLKGNKIKEIQNSKDITFFIDNYYDKKLNKNYLVTANSGNVKSYDFNENKIYFKYFDNDKIYKVFHYIIINDNKEIIEFIGLANDNNIRIWNFHTGDLLKIIYVKNNDILSYNLLTSICLWNNDYFFVGSSDKIIKLVELETGEIIGNLYGHNNEVLSIKKIIHPKYGECLLSQGIGNEYIKLWINQIYNL